MATKLAKGASFQESLRFLVEVDRDYGSNASAYTVQVLRYATDSNGQATGTGKVLSCTATGTPRVYECTDSDAKANGKYIYRPVVVHAGVGNGVVGTGWLLQKTS